MNEGRLTSDIVDAIEKMDAIKKIRNKTINIHQASLDVSCYLSEDFRKDLMNRFLGDVFCREVPNRQPGDSKVKILSEIIKEKELKKKENPVNETCPGS